MTQHTRWTDEAISKSAKDWETLLLGHATFAPAEWIEGAMCQVRDSMTQEIATLAARKRKEFDAYQEEIKSLRAEVAALKAEVPSEVKDTIETALYFLRASDRIEMYGNQLDRIDTALAWLTEQEASSE